jgi:hypothetical protein
LEDLQTTPELGRADVHIKQWGGSVHLLEMDAGLRDWLEASMIADVDNAIVTVSDKKGNKMALDNFRVKVVAASLADKATGKRMFSMEQLKTGEAIAFLASKSYEAVNALADAATKLNKMGDDEVKKLGEDLGRAQVGSSDSSSPENSAAPSESSIVDSQEQS